MEMQKTVHGHATLTTLDNEYGMKFFFGAFFSLTLVFKRRQIKSESEKEIEHVVMRRERA